MSHDVFKIYIKTHIHFNIEYYYDFSSSSEWIERNYIAKFKIIKCWGEKEKRLLKPKNKNLHSTHYSCSTHTH
jgi:hypothetical protein